MRKLETSLLLYVGDAEHEWLKAVVEYTHHRGYRATRYEPGEPEHVEIGRVYVIVGETASPLPEWMIEPLTDQLERMCLDHWRGMRDEALERQAEARREDDMLDRIERRPQAAE